MGPAQDALRRRLHRLAAGLPRPFWALLAGTFVTKAGSFVMPMLFVYLTQARGLSIALAGGVASLHGLGSLLGTFCGGVSADRIGRRATMLLSLVLGAVVMVLLGAATEVWQLAFAALLLGLVGDAYRPASQAVVADIVPPVHRMKAFGLQYWAINLGFSFAAVLGGFMARRHFFWLFMGDAATTLVLAAIVWRAVPESRPAPSRAAGGALTPFVDRRFAPLLALNFVLVLVFFQHLTSLPVDMRAKGLGSEQFGVAVATNGVLIVLLQPFVTRWVARVRRSTLLASGAALTGLGFGLTGLAGSLGAYMTTVAVWTLGEIVLAPVNASIVADMAPAHLRGRYQGAFAITWSLAFMVAPLAGPPLIASVGLDAFWLVCLATGLAVAAAHLVVSPRVLPSAVAPERAAEPAAS